MKKNILLILALVVMSLVLATPVGHLIIPKLFNSGGGFATFSLPSDIGDFINGLPLTYLFLSPLLFCLFGGEKKLAWSVMSTIPILYFLFYIESGVIIWFWSLTFFISGIVVANVINLFKRLLIKNKPSQLK